MAASAQTSAPARESVSQLLKDLLGELGPAKAAGAAPPLVKSDKAETRSSPPPHQGLPQLAPPISQAEPGAIPFYPKARRSLQEAGLTADETCRVILKMLAARGASTGRQVASHVRLLFPIVDELLRGLRKDQLLVFKGEAVAGDYTYVVTEKGLSLAKELAGDCTYFGAMPVTLQQYVAAMKAQSVTDQQIRAPDLKRAFSDLLLEDGLMRMLGPAVNSGRGLFLFGQPGNGKTSVAERVAKAFGDALWIPRAIGIDGQIIRVFDPSIHIAAKDDPRLQRVDSIEIDHRWIRIQRPTVVAGGELTMDELEVTQDPNSRICEAPLQLKSNGGVLLIDDFGRQRMPVDELLNRWIVPLEKRYDLLNLPNGKKVEVPFDQLVIFSTNLEPKDLVDDAFLRRIPYKIEVPDPTPRQFHHIFRAVCNKMGIEYRADVVDYLIEEHYSAKGRPMRACHPRDLLMQVRNLCVYEDRPTELTREAMDFAVGCYFSILS